MAFNCIGERNKDDAGGRMVAPPPVAFLPNARGADQAAEAATKTLFGELRMWLEDTLRPIAAELEALQERQRRTERAVGMEADENAVATIERPSLACGLERRMEATVIRELGDLRDFVASEVARSRVEQRKAVEELRAGQASLQEALKVAEENVLGMRQKSPHQAPPETNEGELRRELEACRLRLDEMSSAGQRRRLFGSSSSPAPVAPKGATAASSGGELLVAAGDGGRRSGGGASGAPEVGSGGAKSAKKKTWWGGK
mmetsp:Transcript_155644/g.497629  ORF Transcript_155644/g.497629 Transcript_155644/m.497629 type:complete len:259 (-) Transcript_155644:106-882(-)